MTSPQRVTRPSASHSWPLHGLALGGDYNPEQWPEEVWHRDVELMREAGVTFVTLGVFSWALLEPEPGRFTFGWLDRVMDLLHAGGIAVDLATATASPPPWLSRRYPEILPVDRSGHRLWPGSRQAWCPSSPIFRERALALVEAMATHYAQHPALAMWHVSNELGCHNARCYCDVSATAFREWLQRRYLHLDALNDAWGTTFWSQHYSDWEEILPPRLSTTHPNPTQGLDWQRFSSDALLDYYCAERDLLRTITPALPVTTNFMVMRGFSALDYWSWAPEQDLISQDHYLDGRLADPVADLAFSADLTRGLAAGGPWFLMEHSTSAVNWQPVNYAKRPGEMLLTSLGHVARGADAVGFFQWRASRAGAEKFHSALVPHAGTDSKVWREVVELGEILARSADVAGTRVSAEVAIVFSWQAWWACDQDSHPSTLVRYPDAAHAAHQALRRIGVVADIVPPDADLSTYRVVVVPTLYLVDDAAADALARYVEAGGHAVVTYFSGIVDEADHVLLGGYPGAFAKWLGVRIEEFFPLAPGAVVHLDAGQLDTGQPDAGQLDTGQPPPGSMTGSIWSEWIHLAGAQALATFADGPVAGHPAITRHVTGDGVAWYVGTALDDASLVTLVRQVCAGAGVSAADAQLADVAPVVDVVRRAGDSGSFLFVLNHGEAEISLQATGHDLVSDRAVEGTLRLAGRSCAIVREKAARQERA